MKLGNPGLDNTQDECDLPHGDFLIIRESQYQPFAFGKSGDGICNPLPHLAVQYAPPNIAPHLFFGALSPTNIFLGEYQRLAALTHVNLKATTFRRFLATHRRFLVYGNVREAGNAECGDCVQQFLSAGYTLKSAHRDTDGVLYEYSK